MLLTLIFFKTTTCVVPVNFGYSFVCPVLHKSDANLKLEKKERTTGDHLWNSGVKVGQHHVRTH